MRVEEVGDEGEIEFGVAGYEGCRGEEFAAVESVRILKDELGPLEKIALL